MVAENNRVDTTFIGYFLIGFVLLLLGVLVLQWAEVFGGTYKDMPIDQSVFFQVEAFVGAILILLAIFAYRTGKQLSAGIFVFMGFFFIALHLDNGTGETLLYNSNWFMTIAFAIFFLIFTIYALVAKAPKFVVVLLLLVTVMALFLGLGFFFDELGPSYDTDVMHPLYIVCGIFAFLAFILATYLGLAYANPKKVPLI